ncbi:MAG TPA: hypothetical protein VH081_11350 [Solirubrobacteraceae bacterium]|jgi:hypothetical protein|nr:hypothetical protein [Solirubrobacteraceae bacterium]
MRPCALAKARRRDAEAPAERAREVRRLAIADEPCDVGDGNRRLLGEQLRRSRHPPREQILVEAQLAELRVDALDLPRRARHGAGDLGERELAPVVARDDDAREQVHTPARRCCLRLHTPHSDGERRAGLRLQA